MIEGSPSPVHPIHIPVDIALTKVVPICFHGLRRYHHHVKSPVLPCLGDILKVTPALRLIFPVFLDCSYLLGLGAPASPPGCIKVEIGLVQLDQSTIYGDEVFTSFLCLIVVAAYAVLETEAEDGAIVEASGCGCPHIRLSVNGVRAGRINRHETFILTFVFLLFVLILCKIYRNSNFLRARVI